MTERTAAAARRLLVVALFLLGFGEGSWSGGESGGVRAALDAGRAFALTAGDTPPQFIAEQDRAAKAAAGLGGGEDDRAATALPAAPVFEAGTLPYASLATAGTPQPHIGFSSRAPPART